jgi:acetylglutamate kinase
MSSMSDLFRAAPHVRLQRGRTMVVKVGGSPLAKKSVLATFARQVGVVHAMGARIVVVHGGGPQTDELERALGETPRKVDGRRVTSEKGLRALRLAVAGEVHGDVVATLAKEGVPAVGVCGASAGLLVAERRPPQSTGEGPVDFGQVGDLRSIDPAPLERLLAAGFVPVVSPPASDGQGGFLNVNADLVAAALAVALGAGKLVLATAAPGVLTDAKDPSSLVSALTLAQLQGLAVEGALNEGMRVKADAIRAAIEGGVERVHVISATDPEALLRELYTNQGAGTLVTREVEAPPAGEPGA